MGFRPFALLASVLAVNAARADDPAPAVDPADVRRAAARGLAVVERSARNYPDHRSCFSCHHQTLPMLAMAAARDHGLRIDYDLLREQADFTRESFRTRRRRMRRGEGVGGASMTVGYGLWALDIAGARRDETTSAMVTFLLRKQESEGHWKRSTSRPPLEDSDLTATVLAVHYMRKFADDTQRQDVETAAARARKWLLALSGDVHESQEDRNSLLGGLRLLRADAEPVEDALRAVLDAQRDDGGWAQLPGMDSDAYATGQTLFVLHRSGVPASHAALRRGVRFLLDTQEKDGSWFVKSRSKPIQTFFDNGDPHGPDQFISIPATSWATTALALALPRVEIRTF